jgi:hypothetical protein
MLKKGTLVKRFFAYKKESRFQIDRTLLHICTRKTLFRIFFFPFPFFIS